MKFKITALVLILCSFISAAGCSVEESFVWPILEPSHQFMQLRFDDQSLGDGTSWVDKITNQMTYSYQASESFTSALPVYQITERVITDSEIQALQESLDSLITDPSKRVIVYRDSVNPLMIRGKRESLKSIHTAGDEIPDFNMSDSVLKVAAQQIFEAIPFITTPYIYLDGTKGALRSSKDGEMHLKAVDVFYVPVINGINVYPCDRIMLMFDAYGLRAFWITLYNYQQIGSVNLVPLEEAKERILCPDSFSSEEDSGNFSNLKSMTVNHVEIQYYNQFYDGCTVLQPVYSFSATVTDEDDRSSQIKSTVIAIPESYTYVAQRDDQ